MNNFGCLRVWPSAAMVLAVSAAVIMVGLAGVMVPISATFLQMEAGCCRH